MHDQITTLLSQALANALKEALVPIVREAVNEALKDTPQADPAHPSNHLEARIDTLESKVESLESDLSDKVDSGDIDDKVAEAVQDCIDNGSWDITFRG